jgi:hypothetical protein
VFEEGTLPLWGAGVKRKGFTDGKPTAIFDGEFDGTWDDSKDALITSDLLSKGICDGT